METQLNLKPYLEDSIPLKILIVLICIITACSVLQKKGLLQTDSLSKVSSNVQSNSDHRSTANAIRIYDRKDSSDRRSYTEIFPDGNFKYSEKEGFSGQAKRVLIATRDKEHNQVHSSEHLAQSQIRRASLTAKVSALTNRKVKEKTAEPDRFIPLYIAGCLLVYAGVYLFRDKLMASLK